MFLSFTAPIPALGTIYPLNQWVSAVYTPGVTRSWREANRSPEFSAEVKNAWSCTSTPKEVGGAFLSTQSNICLL
jgi:hypothetical protein